MIVLPMIPRSCVSRYSSLRRSPCWKGSPLRRDTMRRVAHVACTKPLAGISRTASRRASRTLFSLVPDLVERAIWFPRQRRAIQTQKCVLTVSTTVETCRESISRSLVDARGTDVLTP